MGFIRWMDGQAVPDATVEVQALGLSARTQTDGSYAVTLSEQQAPGPSEPIQAMVLTPCWHSPRPHAVERTRTPDGALRLEHPTLPVEFDLVVDLAIEATLAKYLRNAGYTKIEVGAYEVHDSVATSFPKRVEVAEAPVEGGELVLRALPVRDVSLQFRFERPGPPRTSFWLPQRAEVRFERDRLARVHIAVDGTSLLVARIVDPHGAPLPECRVTLEHADPRSSTGRRESHPPVGPDGTLVFLGIPGDTTSLTVKVLDAVSPPTPLVVGQHDATIVVPLHGHRRLQLTRGGEPIEHYACRVSPTVFGKVAPPPLPRHAGGWSWLPRHPDTLWLAFAADEQIREQPLHVPPGTGDFVVDIETLPPSKMFAVRIDYGTRKTALVTLERIDPPPAMPQADFGTMTDASVKQLLLGFQPGTYRITVRPSLTGELLANTTVTLSEQTTIRIDDLLATPK
jgi:hypothetical protein